MTAPGRRRRWPKVAGALALLLVLAVAIAIFALDAILLSQARKQADALSAQLGRPVTVGGVKTRLLGGLGLRVTDAAVGAGPGEEVPLVTVRRVEVEADLWRAVRSGGKELHVRSAVIEGLHANVVKLPDGTTNAGRAADAYAKANPPAAPAPAEEAAGPPPALRVGRAAIEDARVAFLDRTTPGATELAIDDLDVEVRDLEAGKPLELLLRAAVLAPAQNLSLGVTTAPLPPSLEPTPERIVLALEPVDLGPLGPFLPAAAGFRSGRVAADLDAALGAAVPGGAGPTRVTGAVRALGLAFAGQEGGRALDVTVDLDLEGDAALGDLAIRTLDVAAGPARLTGTGRVTGLRGEAPRFEGLELVGSGLDPAALAAYYPPLREQLGDVVIAGPIGLELRATGSAAAQQATLRVDLGPVRLAVPEQLAKAAGAPASLVARVDAAGGGRARFEATLDLEGVDLRPGETLAKKPGDVLRVTAAGSYRPEGDGAAIDLSSLELAALADRLAGRATVRLAGTGAKATTRFEADLRGDRLDLDALLVPTPEPVQGAPPLPAPEPLDPAAFRGLSGTAALRLGTLRMEKVDARNVVARVKVEEDRVTFEEATLEAFGGTVSAAGTTARLAGPDQPFEVALDLRGLAGASALALLSEHEVLDGKLDATVKLSGKASDPEALTKSLTGALSGVLGGGVFKATDLVAAVTGPLAAKLPFAATRLREGGTTSLGRELPFAFRIADGVAGLERPLSFDAGGQGTFSIEGGVGLDGTLRMPTTLALSPELVARLTGGRAKLAAPLPVAFRLAGPAWKPRLEGLSLDAAVKAIATQAAAGALGRAVGAEGADVKALAEEKKAEAEALAERKRAEAEAAAREEAERAKRKVDEERKRLEDAARRRLEGLLKP